ncbi:MAG: HAMP domain-containing histidine kinase [Chloroflexota bacterium]|nr:HAMP domain-containing histidine kinase [Chloroflexota bacterium]
MFPSLRSFLAFSFTFVVLLVLSVLGFSIQKLVENGLHDNVDAGLQARGRTLAAFLVSDPDSDLAQQAARVTTGLVQTSQDAETTYVRLYDSAGFAVPLGDTAPPIPDATQKELRALRSPRLETIETPDQGELRVLTRPVYYGRNVFAYIQVGRELGPVNRIANDLQNTLVLGTILAAVVAGTLAYVLAHQALKPFSDIVEDTAQIRVEHLNQRLPADYGVAEVSSLAHSFNSLLDRLEKAFELQRRFVADASHELRTPLTSIRGNLDVLLLDPELSPSTREALRKVAAEAARLSRLVTNLLLLARAEAGQSKPRHQPVDLHDLVLETVGQVRGLAHSVSVRLAREEQAIVTGDGDQIRQVLYNLLDNAVKFTPDGGQVSVSVYPEDGWGKVEVRDSGIGIAADDLERVFERFYQAERSPRGTSGSGLGLSIVSWVVRAHGGRITAESKLGEGSTFAVWLPLYVKQPAVSAPAAPRLSNESLTSR